MLIQNEAIVNLRRRNGDTALFAAAEYGEENVINLLIENGAEMDIQNEYGLTPLILATYFGN